MPSSPEAVAHYKILDHIGSGGLGELYRARDTKLGRTVAVRILPASIVADAERVGDLLQAARSAAELSHPNIAALFEVGEDGPHRYLAFEFVPGELLSAKLRGQPLDARRVVDFAVQLADALAEAERRDISHGDIRPGTVVITSKDRPKFLHFGLSRFTSNGSTPRTQPAVLPEAGLGGVSQGALADIRALGLVIDEMLTGRHRPADESGDAVAAPAAVGKAIPSELDAVVQRMLSVDPARRYQTAVTVAAELRVVAAILDARADAAGRVSARSPSARRRGRSLTAIVVLVALAALAFWMWRGVA